MSTPPRSSAWDLAGLLAESTRRRLFDAVRAAGRPLTRDEIAELTGVNRRLATFHLDRLAAAGALAVDYARPADRPAGPGSGRPAKRYTAAPLELSLSVPPRRYDLAARVLAAGIVANPRDAAAGAGDTAREAGSAAGAAHRAPARATRQRRTRALCDALADLGFEPREDEAGEIRLANCPFRSVADLAPDLVCTLNHQLVAGVADGAAALPADVVLDPQPPPACCVTVRLSN